MQKFIISYKVSSPLLESFLQLHKSWLPSCERIYCVWLDKEALNHLFKIASYVKDAEVDIKVCYLDTEYCFKITEADAELVFSLTEVKYDDLNSWHYVSVPEALSLIRRNNETETELNLCGEVATLVALERIVHDSYVSIDE